MAVDTKWLDKNVIKRDLTEAERDALKVLEIATYKEGDNIIEKGQKGGTLYILRSGVAQVEDNNEGIRVRIAGLQEGTIFGEMSFLNDNTASAQVTALGECTVYKLSKDQFKVIMAEHQELAFAIFNDILNEQTAIVQKMNEQFIPILRNIKIKAQKLPLIVKLIPVILIVTYIFAWGYQWKTQEGKHNYQQKIQTQKQAAQEKRLK